MWLKEGLQGAKGMDATQALERWQSLEVIFGSLKRAGVEMDGGDRIHNLVAEDTQPGPRKGHRKRPGRRERVSEQLFPEHHMAP